MKERRWLQLWAAREGLGAIEFGFIAPVLGALLLGVLDFGLAYWYQIEISSVADAGAQWGMGNDYDATGITNAATSATNLTGITVTPANPCGCVNSSTNLISTGYGSGAGGSPPCQACPTGSTSGTAEQYISVTASVCYTTVFPSWPGLAYCSGGSSQCSSAGCSSRQILLTSQSLVMK